MEAIAALEKQRALAIAEEYRSGGFEVVFEPGPELLPDFLREYRPDLLVRKGEETIIVEVRSRASLAKEPHIREMARLLSEKPHLKFELVLLGAEEQGGTPEGSRLLEREEILLTIEAAETLLTSDHPESSLLISWAAMEATIRLSTQSEGVSTEPFNPLYALKQAVANGIISRTDYTKLSKIMRYRNSLAHGFQPIDFEPGIVQELIKITRRLLK